MDNVKIFFVERDIKFIPMNCIFSDLVFHGKLIFWASSSKLTRLYYQGRLYPVTGLERGDVISVDVVDSGGRLWATQIEVVRNVRETGGYY